MLPLRGISPAIIGTGERGELTVGTALTEIGPLHSLMGENIEKLRARAQGRTRHATHRDRPPSGKRKLDL